MIVENEWQSSIFGVVCEPEYFFNFLALELLLKLADFSVLDKTGVETLSFVNSWALQNAKSLQKKSWCNKNRNFFHFNNFFVSAIFLHKFLKLFENISVWKNKNFVQFEPKSIQIYSFLADLISSWKWESFDRPPL